MAEPLISCSPVLDIIAAAAGEREMSESTEQVHRTLALINSAWREGNPSSMREFLHPEIIMVVPGFKQTMSGREILVNSFVEFCKNAIVIEYEESNEHIDAIEGCAVATYLFKMVYERAEYRELSKGRDMWIFRKDRDRWVAVWRAMIELTSERSPKQ
jgi:hypothetical protein